MQEVMLKTHLIVTDVHDEYLIDWCGSIANTHPLFIDNKPVFVIIGSQERVEMNTINIKHIEDCAKRLTHPKGRQAITSDIARIYIKEEDNKLTFLGKVTQRHIKQYQQMYDKFEQV